MTRFSGFLAAAAMGLSLAFTAPALAQGLGENFSIDQSCGIAGAGSACSESGGVLNNIDSINFRYFAVIDQTNDGDGPGGLLNGDPFVEKGFAVWTGYLNDANLPVGPSTLNNDYQVYMIFEAAGTATVQDGEIYATFTSFTISIYMDDNFDTTLAIPAFDGANGSVGPVVVNDAGGEDALLATANLILAGEAHLEDGLANGDFEIIVSELGLNMFGESFFTNPAPFYTIMNFAGNTAQVNPAGSPTSPFEASANGDGQLFFTVPEPGTLGLLGAGLMGAAAFLRRRKSAKAA